MVIYNKKVSDTRKLLQVIKLIIMSYSLIIIFIFMRKSLFYSPHFSFCSKMYHYKKIFNGGKVKETLYPSKKLVTVKN